MQLFVGLLHHTIPNVMIYSLVPYHSQVEEDKAYSACTSKELKKQYWVQQILHTCHQSAQKV
jgi:hypothetical protein